MPNILEFDLNDHLPHHRPHFKPLLGLRYDPIWSFVQVNKDPELTRIVSHTTSLGSFSSKDASLEKYVKMEKL